MKTILFLTRRVIWLYVALFWTLSEQATAQSAAAIMARVDSLNDLSFYAQEPESAKRYAREAEAAAVKINYRKGLADSYLRLGQAAYAASQLEDAGQYFRKSLIEREKMGDRPDIASCCNELGKLYNTRGAYDSAAVWFQRGLHTMEHEPAHINTIVLNSNIGHLYRITGKYNLAKLHLDSALLLYSHLMKHPPANYTAEQLTLKLAAVRLDMAEFLQSALHQYPSARDSLLKCLETFKAGDDKANIAKCLLLLGNNAYFSGDLTWALDYYQQGIALGNQANMIDLFTLYRNRGRVFLDQGRHRDALADFRTSLAAFQGPDYRQHAAAVLSEIGNFYYELSEADSAIHYYKLSLAQDIQDPMLKGRLYYFLSDILYQAGKESESQDYAGAYIKFLEELKTGQTIGIFTELTSQFLDKNRLLRRITLQEKQTQKTYGLIALGALTLLALLAILFARLQRQKRRLAERDTEIARQQEALAKQKEEIAVREHLETLKNKELETHYARLEGQDAMQKKIGLELHDSVGAMLASVKLNLSPVDEVLDRLPEDKRKQYATANRLLGEASEEVRRISHELSSAVLLKFGLKAQLEALADIIPGSGKLQVELATHGLKERLDNKTELHIYRMVQELVHNVVKHAQAQNISIQVNRFDDRINVIVEDDGQGFDVEKIREKTGLGMQNLAARVHDLGGELQIDSRPGHGTTVSIDIPLKS